MVVDQLIGVTEAIGPDRSIDLDNAAQRESLDVIGRIGFDTDFQAMTSMASNSGANRALDALHGGELQILRHAMTIRPSGGRKELHEKEEEACRRGITCLCLRRHVCRHQGGHGAGDGSVALPEAVAGSAQHATDAVARAACPIVLRVLCVDLLLTLS